MAKKKKKKIDELDAYRTPSAVAVAARLHPGAGAHTESKEERNKRTGRLKGNEKRKIESGEYE